ncbi:MAG: ABC transporter permease [Clostridium sp.]
MIRHNLNFMILKNKGRFILTIAVPVIVVLLISKFLMGNTAFLKVGIINNDNSVAANYIEQTLKSNDNISIVNCTSVNELNKDFSDNNIQAAVIINKDFSSSLINGKVNDINIIGKDGDSTYEIVKELINSNLDNILKLGIISKGNENTFNTLLKNYESKNINIQRESVTNLSLNYEKASLFIGFLIMFIFYRAVSGAERVNEDRESKVFTRIFISDIKTWQYYGGNIIASLVCVSIQIILSVFAMEYVTKINFGISLGSLIFILILAGLIAVSIGTVCIALTRNTQEASMISNILILVLVMAGGCFIPTSIFPKTMDTISKFLPTRWIMDIVSNMQNGQSLVSQYKYLILLLLLSIALLLVAAYFTKRKDKSFLEV